MDMDTNDLSTMRLASGLNINFELEGGDGSRYVGKLIGLMPGRSVLVSTPILGDHRPLLIRKDQAVICRFFSHKVACAFRSHVSQVCTIPFNYLHVAWPESVAVGTVRNSERVIANLDVQVTNPTNKAFSEASGAMVDISASGARLETTVPLGVKGDQLLIKGDVTVGHVTRSVSIEAIIRVELERFEMSSSTAAYGIEFKYVSDIDFLAIQAYVNRQLVNGAER